MRAIVLGFGLAVAVTASVDANAPTVTLGKIENQTPKASVSGELKSAVEHEIGAMDFSTAKDHYVLSATLVTLETVNSDDRVESTAVVTAELSNKKGGTLRAMFKGRAHAVDTKDSGPAAELTALKAAVRSAVKRLPEVVH